MTRNEIADFWGATNLNRWANADWEKLSLSESSKSYLIEVGLPIGESWTLKFDYVVGQLPEISYNPNYFCIGIDDFVPICIDCNLDDRIIAIENAVTKKERFINSSIDCFGEFLVYYAQYRRTIVSIGEHEIEEFINLIKTKMETSDPFAFMSAETWCLL